MTRGRGLELEKQIEQVRRDLAARVEKAEERAAAAEARSEAIYEVLQALTLTKRKD